MPEQIITPNPELDLLSRELEVTREILNLNTLERRQIRDKLDRLQQQFNSSPRTDIERKIIGILSRYLVNPIITLRRTASSSGMRCFEISFTEVEDHVILYAEAANQLYQLGYYVESVGTDFIYIAKR